VNTPKAMSNAQETLDHLSVPKYKGLSEAVIVNDVTQLNPVPVWAISRPTSLEELVDSVRRTNGPLSVGGGHFSMGGQTASPGSLHLDMRSMNRVIDFKPEQKTIRVQSGTRWCDIQRFVDPHNLSVKIMQTYANFTVGGSLSVNVHGRYMGLGPVILSVLAIKVVMTNGEVIDASPTQNPEIFFGVIGGYGGLGILAEVEFSLADNVRVERIDQKMASKEYVGHFFENIRSAPGAVFHNADLYPPEFERARSVTWMATDKPVTEPLRMHKGGQNYGLERYFLWAFTETPFGKWRREHIVDPLIYATKKVHWRNFEASYDAGELEPASRKDSTYVLQEYFVPVERFNDFVPKMSEILQRHNVNAVNVSVRHAHADSGSVMAWSRTESFAFVLYHKQGTSESAKTAVGVWTRELIDAVIAVGGCHYLPYQAHATHEQFHAAYPRAKEMFALKAKHDPLFRLRNVLWDKYYGPTLGGAKLAPSNLMVGASTSEFKAVFQSVHWHDRFFKFLQNVYRIYPEARFQQLLKDTTEALPDDDAIYQQVQRELPSIKPFLSDVTMALPALFKQKREMASQTLQILNHIAQSAEGTRHAIDGYMEIGSTGRYISELQKHMDVRGRIILVNDVAPTNSPADIFERGGLFGLGEFVPMGDYEPLPSSIPTQSLDVVTCYIGLHHCPLHKLEAFIASIARVLRPGGVFILRDHDVTTPDMHTFVSLVHTVFNAGLNVARAIDAKELRHFKSIDEWSTQLQSFGFHDCGLRVAQANDPSDNLLLGFQRLVDGSK
jgi:FAD/FMN-containing dehydrogenase